MTTTEITHDKKVLATEKVDASIKAPVDKFGKTHESSDIVNMEKAKIEADKVAGTAKDADLKAAEETKHKSGTDKDRS
jgi:hypothetical protein